MIGSSLALRVFCKAAAKRQGVRKVHLFHALGRHQRVFWPWLFFSGSLLFWGKLPRQDTELVILRVAYLCDNEYELQQHTREALKAGVTGLMQEDIFDFDPDASFDQYRNLSWRQIALLWATDELVAGNLTRGVRNNLKYYLNEQQLIEFCLLVVQYTGLAKVINALGIENDFPDE